MNFNFFNDQIQRLVSTFGKTNFSDERVKLIWNISERLNENEFKQIVNHFLANARYAPLPDDFNQAVKAELKSRPQGYMAIDVTRGKPCTKCLGTGEMEAQCIVEMFNLLAPTISQSDYAEYVRRHDKTTLGVMFGFICDCSNGASYNGKAKVRWSDTCTQYYMPIHQQEFLPTPDDVARMKKIGVQNLINNLCKGKDLRQLLQGGL